MIDMDKGNLNKLVTNYPVELTPEEVENLSQTLSSVRTAREDDKTYTGEGFVNVNNTNNVISLTNEANEKLNQPIPTKVSDLTDSASYQTVSGMDEYLTKTSASENLAPLSITDDIESLKNASSDWNKVSAKLDTTAFSTVSGNYAFKNDLNDYYQKTETSSKGELDIAFESKQDKLIFGYDENNSISSINNTALAGQDVTTYSAGKYIEIDENNTISVTGLMPLNEYAQYEPVLIGDSNITATSSKVDSHTQWNLAINSKPVITDTKLVGENSITAHTTNVSGEWVVGLEESAHNAIASVAGIATDVGTLKTASAGWDKVSAKLDVTSFSTVSGTFLTEIPDTYATKNDLNTASSTLTSIDNDLSGHIDYVSAHSITSLDDYYTKTQVNSTFALKTEIPTTVTQLTDSGNYYQKTETSSKTEITNALNTKVDNPSQQTGLLVYDGDISAWVSMPPDTTIVQGQGSITSNYESNSTYTVSLLASAENALKKVVNKIDTTAVEQKYQTKDDMSNYLTTSEASTIYQPIGDYATQSDISDMATQTWVGQQGFYTKASADNDYAPKTITATVNTLTNASAGWNEVSAISRIDSVLANKKDKQNELTFNGSSTKTIKSITQNSNGEMNVEFEDIDLPSQVPNVDITSEDSSVNITSSVDAGTNTKTFDLSVNVDDKIPDPSTSNPLMDGTASVGTSIKYAREDHVHPSDTSKEAVLNKTTVVMGTSNTKYPTDKAVADFVNSSVATNTANYISNNGEPFKSVEELEAYTGTVTNNDYAFVTGTDSEGNTYYDRYKATVSGSTVTWALEYRLNNSSFTAAQWAAINSGITSVLVAKIHDHSNKDVLDGITSSDVANWNSKQNSLTAGDNITIDGNTISSDQIFVATYGTTKYAEVKAAYYAGKLCTVFKDSCCYYVTEIRNEYIKFGSVSPNPNIYSLTLTPDNKWSSYRPWLQLHLTFDTTPTDGSKNPVTSNGIKAALDSRVPAPTSTTGTQVLKCIDGVVQWVTE